jgi:flagellar basal-body rod protein FlgC
MVPPLDSTLSALQAFGRKLGITAANIANVNTEGFKKSRAVLQEGRYGGVEAGEKRIETPGLPLETGEVAGAVVRESSNVALEEEIPDLITTVYGFRANLKAVKALDEMTGSLLDTLA